MMKMEFNFDYSTFDLTGEFSQMRLERNTDGIWFRSWTLVHQLTIV